MAERIEPNRQLYPDQGYQEGFFKRTPDRPLGAISDYVVAEMPTDLQAVRNGLYSVDELVAKVGKLVDSYREGFLGGRKFGRVMDDIDKRDLAMFDLVMLQAAIGRSGGTPPEKLTQMVQEGAQKLNRTPSLTYEDVIFTNPLTTDPRTFYPLNTETGREELDFYETHIRIEEMLDEVNTTMRSSVDRLSQRGLVKDRRGSKILTGKGVTAVQEVTAALQQYGFGIEVDESDQQEHEPTYAQRILDGMDRVGLLMHRDRFFTGFRRYFVAYPPEVNGPSGQFSPGFPLLELLQAGESLWEGAGEGNHRVPGNHEYNQKYYLDFPVRTRAQIDEAYNLAREGKSLNALSARLGDPEPLLATLQGVDAFLRAFRGKHIRGVMKQLAGKEIQDPNEVQGQDVSIEGTAHGDNSFPMLQDRWAHNNVERPMQPSKMPAQNPYRRYQRPS